MSVYFVYRSHDTPSLNHVKKFEAATVLEWFQKHWKAIEDHNMGYDYVEETMGCSVYGFPSLFHAIAEHSLAPPQTTDDLRQYLEEHLYVEGEIRFAPHAIQVLTDDDELEMAYYFFDDDYLVQQSGKAAFLLHETLELPASHGKGNFDTTASHKKLQPLGSSAGTTWLAFLAYYDSLNLTDLAEEGPWQLDKTRVPDLVRYLVTVTPPEGSRLDGGWPQELLLLRNHLLTELKNAQGEAKSIVMNILANASDEASWQVYSDWLEDHGQHRAERLLLERGLERTSQEPGKLGASTHDPEESLIQVEEHMAQLCLPTAEQSYHRWIIFDDLWASEHSDLANAILYYANRWDVLS
jgi:uncharacterized protein (TIGR02996 family)